MIITKNIWTKKKDKTNPNFYKFRCFGSSLWMSKQSMPPMSLELGHYRWCHTGYCYTHFPKQCLGCMAPSVIKNKGTPQMSRERKYKFKMTRFWISIICSTNEPNLWFLYSLFKLSLYNCDRNILLYCIVLHWAV